MKISSFCAIQGRSKVIKKFLGANTRNTVYMGELQGIQDYFRYTLGQSQESEIPIFTDNQTALSP